MSKGISLRAHGICYLHSLVLRRWFNKQTHVCRHAHALTLRLSGSNLLHLIHLHKGNLCLNTEALPCLFPASDSSVLSVRCVCPCLTGSMCVCV